MSTLAKRIETALVGLVPSRADEAVQELGELYVEDMVFRDPIQEVHGLPAFLAMNRRLLKRMRSLAWTITLAEGSEDVALLEWTMRGVAKPGVKFQVDGMTRARARDGKVIDHRDYWDLGELALSPLPGGARLLRAMLSPFA
jgi:ketosteroid isomerase-like protein